MINSITTTNHLGESLTIELRSPEKSGFLIQNIEGLGPSKADINLTDIVGYDGGLFNSTKVQNRNIVLTLGFLDDVETNRQRSYKYFPLKRRIKFQIDTDNRSCYTYGYIETNEPGIFSSKEACVISIICPDAYLYDVNPQSTVFASVTALFEFPFSNESLVSPLIEFGDIIAETIKTIIYQGDASVGFKIIIHAIGNASNVDIINSETLDKIGVDSTKLAALTGSDLVEGDDIIISTVKGNKYAKLLRGTSEYNILSTLDPNPVWFQLEKGDNLFAYTATAGLSNLEFRIDNEIAYEGI